MQMALRHYHMPTTKGNWTKGTSNRRNNTTAYWHSSSCLGHCMTHCSAVGSVHLLTCVSAYISLSVQLYYHAITLNTPMS
jgi:hypothetical protein